MTDFTPLEKARADLAAAEQAVRDAKSPEAVADLIGALQAAQVEVVAAKLADEGHRRREAAKRDAVLACQEADAKLAALRLLTDRPDLLRAYRRAVDALADLVRSVQRQDEWISKVAAALDVGGVPALGWDRIPPKGFDATNYATVEQGGVVSSVTIGGEQFAPQVPGEWARHVLRVIADRYSLEDRHGKRISNALGKDVPDALRNR